MRSRRLALAGLALLALGCSEAFAPVSITAPDSLRVQARSMTSALIEWPAIENDNVIAYQVERRTSFTGPFDVVAEQVPQSLPGPVSYLDASLEPETFYGYRIRVVDRYGGVSEPSIVRGTRTPPLPAILLRTVSVLEAAAAADPDGYVAVIRSGTTDSLVGPIAANSERRFGPLQPGAYQVTLTGLASNCSLTDGQFTVPATVTDVGLETLAHVNYVIHCADPSLGRLLARVVVAGEDRDSNGYRLRLDGVHPQAPESLRVTSDTVRLNGPDGGQREWTRLRPGDFQVSLEDVHPKCTRDARSASVAVGPLSSDTVVFTVTCPTPPPPDTTTPWPPGYRLSNSWSAVSGGRVTLTVALDMGAFNSPEVNGAAADDIFAIQGSTQYDATRLRFVSATNVASSGLQNATTNGSVAGVVQWGNFSTHAAKQTGSHGLVAITFDVVGTGTVTTRTAVDASAAVSQDGNDLFPNIVIRESGLNLSGGGGNAAPVAEANGPYAGTVGTPISFSSAGSSDPGGSIAGYAWTFGDGGSSSQANPSHGYAAAGTYQARLTVTDNLGLTNVDSATVTVTAGGGGGNTPPVAVANGPYFGTAGTAVVFNATGSHDPGGSIVSYAWSFGDGATGSGVQPQHTYTAAGTYTVTLTVTDNGGATAQAAASVSISPAGGGATPFTWRSVIAGTPAKGAIITVTITLDLTTDIPETSGPEQLASFVLDSLVWNPAVLEWSSTNYGLGITGSQQRFPNRLAISNVIIDAARGNNAGLIQIATIRFKVLASPGTTASLTTFLGPLIGAPATGGFNYRSRTAIVDPSVVTQ